MTVEISAGQSALLFLVLIRCTGFVFAAPIFGHHALPTLVKFGLAAAFAVALATPAGATAGTLPLLLAAPLELVIGLSLGFILSMGFAAVELAGRVISIQLGLSLANVFSPTEEESSTAIDPLFSVMAGLLFFAMGLHLALVQVLAHSFLAYPIGGGWPSGIPILGAQTIALAIELGVRVALPMALVLLLLELAVAMVARAIPQINVFIFGLPLKLLVGVAVLAVAIPSLLAGASAVYRFIFQAASGGAVST